MKPFNLQEALAGKKVVTRDGQAVTKLVHFPNVTGQPVVYAVGGRLYTAWADGKYALDGGERYLDLFMATKVKEAWINLYTDGDTSSRFYNSAYEADQAIHGHPNPSSWFKKRIGNKAHRITWEE